MQDAKQVVDFRASIIKEVHQIVKQNSDRSTNGNGSSSSTDYTLRSTTEEVTASVLKQGATINDFQNRLANLELTQSTLPVVNGDINSKLDPVVARVDNLTNIVAGIPNLQADIQNLKDLFAQKVVADANKIGSLESTISALVARITAMENKSNFPLQNPTALTLPNNGNLFNLGGGPTFGTATIPH